ncbi:Tho complex subunit 7-domain-containing protein, partial [Plectosphaerella plurivora]
MSSWDLLDEKDEQELHKVRLLNVEERPFKRITKRLGAVCREAREKLNAQQPTPPPESTPPTNGDARQEQDDQTSLRRQREELHEDILLDFAAFDSTIARLQFLLDANERERQRYAADQERILAECQAVRANNTALRERLDEARGTLAQRKAFDRMADDITGGKAMLRPRDDQRAAIRKLEDECAELERESGTYGVVWRERKAQFEQVMDEAMRLRRQIRDEKEEVERREGMDEDAGEEDGEVSRGGGTPHPGSRGTTPRPDGEAGTPLPMGTSGARTPAPDSQADGTDASSLKPRRGEAAGSTAGSREATPQPLVDDGEIEEGEDVEMDDEPSARDHTQATSGAATPRITIDAPDGGDDRMEVDA